MNSEQSVEAQGFLSDRLKVFDRYEMQKDLVVGLEKTKYHQHLAAKVHACHKEFRKRRCEQNHEWVNPSQAHRSCSVRLCPHCSHRKAKMLATRLQKFLVGQTGLRYMVLSERNSKNLEEGKASLWAAWTKMRRSVLFKGKVKGCIAVLEVTFNLRKKTWHPHLNILMQGEYFPQAALKRAWIAATEGRGQTAFIRAADEGTVYELIKYTAKLPDLIHRPAVLDEFLAAMHGARLIRTYGSFRGFNVDEEVEEVEEKCPDCGSAIWIDTGSVHYEQLGFDFDKKVFRVRAPAEVARGFPSDIVTIFWKKRPGEIATAAEMKKRARGYESAVRGAIRHGFLGAADESVA